VTAIESWPGGDRQKWLDNNPGNEQWANGHRRIINQGQELLRAGNTWSEASQKLGFDIADAGQFALTEQRAIIAERRVRELEDQLETRSFYDLTHSQQDRFRDEMRNEIHSSVRREVERTIEWNDLPPETQHRVVYEYARRVQRRGRWR
jgi:hypothetical protein